MEMENNKPSNKKLATLCLVSVALAIGVCVYFLLTFADFQQKMNEHWDKQLKQCTCPWDKQPQPYNKSLTLPLFNITLSGES